MPKKGYNRLMELKISRLHKDQAGVAAILITMIMTIVISLLVLGYAQIASEENRESLDRQLSAQAFYASESGINDAISVINNNPTSTLLSKTQTCTTDPNPASPYNVLFDSTKPPNILDQASDVAYTCLLVNPTPSSLQYNVGNTKALVVPIDISSGTGIQLSWQEAGVNENNPSTYGFTGCQTSSDTFPPSGSSWDPSESGSGTGLPCAAGVLRMDLVAAATVSSGRSGLTNSNNVLTDFATPCNGPAPCTYFPTIDFPPTPSPPPANGIVTPVICYVGGTPDACHINITGLSPNTPYYLRLLAIYGTQSLGISAIGGGSSNPTFSDAQVVIDSTGKANFVLRRIQARVPLNQDQNLSSNALQSTSTICKQFSIIPTANGGTGIPQPGLDASSDTGDCATDGY